MCGRFAFYSPHEAVVRLFGVASAKEKAIGARMINARSETLAEKPSFRNAFRRRRCLVLADGYYEWQRSGAAKQPYFIAFDDGQPFGMAGLWERWRDPASGEPLESCCVVTTAPAAAIAHVHDRMPAIVPPEAYAEWLDPTNEATDRLARLLQPCQRADLRARPVSSRVNDARHQGADLVEPI